MRTGHTFLVPLCAYSATILGLLLLLLELTSCSALSAKHGKAFSALQLRQKKFGNAHVGISIFILLMTAVCALGAALVSTLKNKWSIVMKIKMYPLIERIVEEGIESGYNRARKHTDSPDEETVKQCIEQYIMNGFDEYFEFAE